LKYCKLHAIKRELHRTLDERVKIINKYPECFTMVNVITEKMEDGKDTVIE
jgi:hypothetical protein